VTGPRIENSDRGITLNKQLAWTIATALIACGIWVGFEVNAARSGIASLTERQNEDRAEIKANTRSIADLQSLNARLDQRLTGIEQSAHRTEVRVEEILRELRRANPQ